MCVYIHRYYVCMHDVCMYACTHACMHHKYSCKGKIKQNSTMVAYEGIILKQIMLRVAVSRKSTHVKTVLTLMMHLGRDVHESRMKCD